VRDEVCPVLAGLVRNHGRPIDPRLGVPGLPQSATGQTALLTGVNAQAMLRRHVEGFPGPELRAVIEGENIFSRCRDLGISATFANAYLTDDLESVRSSRRQSVTTVATMAAFGRVRTTRDMLAHRAVCHDLTRETLAARGYTGPTISLEQAAEDLCDVASDHQFTLFEHFLTDRAGHAMDIDRAEEVLRRFDRFLSRACDLCAKKSVTLVLTSDHGNIEDLSRCTHTTNDVPFVAVGPAATRLHEAVHTIADVTPALLRWLPGNGHQGGATTAGLSRS
jgi:hypothetical protein